MEQVYTNHLTHQCWFCLKYPHNEIIPCVFLEKKLETLDTVGNTHAHRDVTVKILATIERLKVDTSMKEERFLLAYIEAWANLSLAHSFSFDILKSKLFIERVSAIFKSLNLRHTYVIR